MLMFMFMIPEMICMIHCLLFKYIDKIQNWKEVIDVLFDFSIQLSVSLSRSI